MCGPHICLPDKDNLTEQQAGCWVKKFVNMTAAISSWGEWRVKCTLPVHANRLEVHLNFMSISEERSHRFCPMSSMQCNSRASSQCPSSNCGAAENKRSIYVGICRSTSPRQSRTFESLISLAVSVSRSQAYLFSLWHAITPRAYCNSLMYCTVAFLDVQLLSSIAVPTLMVAH